MPAPKRIAADQRFSQIDEISRANGETNDRSGKALSLALDVPYEKAHAALASEGRKHRGGTHVPAIRAAFAKLGGEFITVDPADFISRYPGAHKNLKSVTTHHPDRFNKGLGRWQHLPHLCHRPRVGRAQWREPRLDTRPGQARLHDLEGDQRLACLAPDKRPSLSGGPQGERK